MTEAVLTLAEDPEMTVGFGGREARVPAKGLFPAPFARQAPSTNSRQRPTITAPLRVLLRISTAKMSVRIWSISRTRSIR